jgi:hypothetical protein
VHKLTETAKGGYLMHENSFRPEEQEFNKNRDRFQQNFEDEMEEIFMDLRFFVC